MADLGVKYLLCVCCGCKIGFSISPNYVPNLIINTAIIVIVGHMIWRMYVDSNNRYTAYSGIRHVINSCSYRPVQTHTLWQNFGLWNNRHRDTQDDYVQACESLVLHVAGAAGVQNGDVILDVGVGCGDQDLLLADRYPSSIITAIEYGEDQVTTARHRVETVGKHTQIDIQQGNATKCLWQMRSHSFNKVLCIDAAYHFKPRIEFLYSAYKVLKPGGVIGLMDFTFHFGSGMWAQITRRLVGVALRLPTENLYDINQYRDHMASALFIDITMQDISQDVIYGFHHYISHIHSKYGQLFNMAIFWKLTVLAQSLVFLHRCGILQSYVITGRKLGP